MALELLAAETAYTSADEEVRRAAVAQVADSGNDAIRFLVGAMGDESWRVRKEAASRLSGWADRPRAAAALVEALAEPENVGRRNAAIEGLVTLGPLSVSPLCAALEKRPDHRKVLVDTIGLIADASGAEPLVPLLEDSDPNVRVAAAEALGQIGGAVAQQALKRAIRAWSGELLLTLAALDGLNRTGAHLSLEELEPLAEQPMLRAAVLDALARSGDERALALLSTALGDRGRSVREAAIRATAELYERLDDAGQRRLQERIQLHAEAVQGLVQALMEGTLGVQKAAVRVLGLTRRVEAVRPLTLALGDPELRDAAMLSLVAIGAPGVEALVALAPDLEGRLRADVYSLLPQFGPIASEPRVQALLCEALAEEDAEAAAGAAHALGEVGTREALAPLLRALEREEVVAQAAAGALGLLGARHYDEVRILIFSRGLSGPDAPHLCRVLGACGRAADTPFLRAALGADSSEVRRAAADALSQLPLPSTVEVDEALLFALADESAEVRAAAARALGAHALAMTAQAVDALERAAHDLEMAVRVSAARALGQIARLPTTSPASAAGPKKEDLTRAVVVLRRLADAPEAVAAVPALEALGAIGDPADDDRLLGALGGADTEIVKAAARALGARGGALSAERAREGLAAALRDPRWDVRRTAALALGEHGSIAHPILYARKSTEIDPLVVEAIDEAMSASLYSGTSASGGAARPPRAR